MERLELKVKELQDVVYDDSENFKVIESNITGTWRHGEQVECIVIRQSDNKLFRINYRDSVKDECEFCDMNYDGSYEEVVPVKVTVIKYKTVE